MGVSRLASVGRAAAAGLLLAAAQEAWAVEVVVDNDEGAPGYVESGGPWRPSASAGWNGGTYVFLQTYNEIGTATWTPAIPEAGTYEVVALVRVSGNRSPGVPYTVVHAGGTTQVVASQVGSSGVQEISLGEFVFEAGTGGSVTVTNAGATSGAVISDAMMFRTPLPPVDEPPSVANQVRSPSTPEPDQPALISATFVDDGGIASATLHWSASPQGGTGSAPMAPDGTAGNWTWEAEIPGFPAGTSVTYYVEGTDTGGNVGQGVALFYVVGQEAPAEYRCVWADSWNASFLNPSQAQELVDTCRAANINTIIPEIRKIGDAYYDSALEPRATNISGGADFDPLQHLIDLCHDTSGGKQYIHVHGWFVMHRISKGETLSPQHVLAQHPEYEMLRSDGTSAPGNRFLDPGHPGVPEHNIAVILDCMSKYDLDGVNLDYIRYPETTGSWGYNAASVARFNAFMGRTGTPEATDPDWQEWRRRMVSQEVKKLYVQMMKLKPHVVLTACTVNWGFDWANFEMSSAYAGVFQDWVGWLQEGIIDYNAIMNYSNENTYPGRYAGWTDLSLASDDIRGSIIGIGAYLQDELADSMWQLEYARAQGAAGLNIYDWGSEVNADDFGATREDFYEQLRTQVFPTPVDPPPATWKTAPTKGVVEGTVTCGGEPVDHAVAMIDGQPQTAVYTDAFGWFAIMEVAPGTHTLRFQIAGESDVLVQTTVAAGEVVEAWGACQPGPGFPGDAWQID